MPSGGFRPAPSDMCACTGTAASVRAGALQCRSRPPFRSGGDRGHMVHGPIGQPWLLSEPADGQSAETTRPEAVRFSSPELMAPPKPPELDRIATARGRSAGTTLTRHAGLVSNLSRAVPSDDPAWSNARTAPIGTTAVMTAARTILAIQACPARTSAATRPTPHTRQPNPQDPPGHIDPIIGVPYSWSFGEVIDLRQLRGDP